MEQSSAPSLVGLTGGIIGFVAGNVLTAYIFPGSLTAPKSSEYHLGNIICLACAVAGVFFGMLVDSVWSRI